MCYCVSMYTVTKCQYCFTKSAFIYITPVSAGGTEAEVSCNFVLTCCVAVQTSRVWPAGWMKSGA